MAERLQNGAPRFVLDTILNRLVGFRQPNGLTEYPLLLPSMPDGATPAAIAKAIGVRRVLHANAQPASVTGTLTKTELRRVTIPGGSMGPNGRLRISSMWTTSQNTNAKNLYVEFGGTAFLLFSQTTAANAGYRDTRDIANVNSESVQKSWRPSQAPFGSAIQSIIGSPGAINTAVDQDLIFYGQLANTGDSIILEDSEVELVYMP